MQCPEIHGHRGCRGLRPENTVPAFLHALELGVDVLELDVVISQDGHVVVAHEPWLSPELGSGPQGQSITASEGAAFNFYEMPYAAIRQCMVGSWPHPRFPEQQAMPTHRPLLKEVVQHVEAHCLRLRRPPVIYAIELKSVAAAYGIYQPTPAKFLAAVLDTVQQLAISERTRLLCFDPVVLQLAHSWQPALPLCLLTENAIPPAVALQCLGFLPDFLGPDFQLLSPALIAELRQIYPKLLLVPWTVNELGDLLALLEMDLAGITTDYPNRLTKLLTH